MIAAKIHNQRTELLRASKYPRRAVEARAALRRAADEIRRLGDLAPEAIAQPVASIRQMLLLREARAAAWYWQAFARLLPGDLGFERRHGRGARDTVNILLNYGYWHLFQRVWLAVERRGLNPFLGLLHTGRHGAPGLVLDLMEEFRQPVVDRVVLELIGRRTALQTREGRRLTLRSRRIVTRALARAFARRDRAATFLQHVDRQAARFALAVEGRGEYTAYRSRW